MPPAPILAGAAGALNAAVCVLAGVLLGPVALVLVVPMGLLTCALARRAQVRERRLARLSSTDPLTGLGNGRLLHERLRYELARHRRHGRPFAVLALDLDGFKGVNDRFGHPAGDEVLRDVAGALRRAVREQDTVVRQGGDEFCVLAPETGPQESDALVARVGLAVAGATGGLDGLSASVGAAVFPRDGDHAAGLLAAADAAAVAAKRTARRARAA